MRKRPHALIILGLLTTAGIGAYWYLLTPAEAQLAVEDVMGPTPTISAPRREDFPSIKIGDVVGWGLEGRPVAGSGLKVAAFADKLDHPRWMLVLSNGDILVSESSAPTRKTQGIADWIGRTLIKRAGGADPSADRITLLRDTNDDGVADFRSILLSKANGLFSPSGMAVVGETLYVGNTNALLSFPFKVGDTRIGAKGTKLFDIPASAPNNHWARNVVASPDGSNLYITVGSNSNIGENGMESERARACVYEYDLKTRERRIFATGLRNPNGLAWEPSSKALWVTVNERDMLGPDVPPDYMTQLDFGANYGWPQSYWGGYEDLRVEPRLPDELQYFKRPDYALGPHTASLGLSFANGAALGPAFANGAFVAQHGSWNRVPASGYKVLFIPFGDNGFPAKGGKRIDVLTGFLSKDGDAQGRPVDVRVDKRGGLLVTDDAGGRIWRVTAS
jgi:glucose/arabinose dehydrogenase